MRGDTSTTASGTGLWGWLRQALAMPLAIAGLVLAIGFVASYAYWR
jgi:hypothetical protein